MASRFIPFFLLFIANTILGGDKIFDAPDQVVWHAPSRSWFISNLGGGISLEKDNNAWISQVGEYGNVIEPYWIGKNEGMHAISGMTITDDKLFACDREGVYEIDINNRRVLFFYKIEGAEFINDIARSKNGDLYISDFFGNRIYKISFKTKSVEVWLESSKLKTPDGLYIDNDNLIIASWGILKNKNGFETSELGDLLSVNLNSKVITPIVEQAGNLEGITKADNHFYVSDWAAGKILKINPHKKTVTDFIVGLKNPTDPDYSRELNTLAFPQHGTNQVLYINLN